MNMLRVSLFRVGTAALAAPSKSCLLVGRSIQGVGAASILPLSTAIWPQVFPAVGAVALAFLALLPPCGAIEPVVLALAISGLAVGLNLPAMHPGGMLPLTETLLRVAAGICSTIGFVGEALGTAFSTTTMRTSLEQGTPLIHAHQMAFCAPGVDHLGMVVALGMHESECRHLIRA